MELVLTAVDAGVASAFRRLCGDLPCVEVVARNIFEVACDAFVSPANSFGFMDGGIDAHYLSYFGLGLEGRVRQLIELRHGGELLVGQADIIDTRDDDVPWLVIAPTMRVPMTLGRSVNAYLAMRAVLLLLTQGRFEHGPCVGKAVGEVVKRVALPGLGTGVGGLDPMLAAWQMRVAIEEIVHAKRHPALTTAEARARHRRLLEVPPDLVGG